MAKSANLENIFVSILTHLDFLTILHFNFGINTSLATPESDAVEARQQINAHIYV